MLIGYGAHAICPYLAYETARQWRLSSRTQSLIKSGKVGCAPEAQPDMCPSDTAALFDDSLCLGPIAVVWYTGADEEHLCSMHSVTPVTAVYVVHRCLTSVLQMLRRT